MSLVFVYGTLKDGGRLHYHLEEVDFIGEFVTRPSFTMYDLGWYPGVIDKGATAITGEVYSIDDYTLRALDALEGYPDLYTREQISTTYGPAWIYLYNQSIKHGSVISSGNWEN